MENETGNNYIQFSTKLGDDIVVLRRDADYDREAFWAEVDALRAEARVHFPAAAEAQAKASAPDGTKSFQVEMIKLAAGGENPRWSVMGGNFKKFGVSMWSEVVDAAKIKLDPMAENKPTGTWFAHYTEKVNDEGKNVPNKVVRLEKVG